MSIPIFDHKKEVAITNKDKRTFLSQDGHTFTYAAYDKASKRYIPEPRYISPDIISRDDMRGKFDDLIFRSTELERCMREMRGHIGNNLDQFIEREESYWAVERTKLENQIAKLESRNKELEDELFEAQTQAAKFEEESKTYAAQIQVYEKSIAKFKEDKEVVSEKRGPGRPSAKMQ